MSLLIRGPFQWWIFTGTSQLMKKLFCYNSITGRQIAANIYTYHHSAALFSCGKLHSNNYCQVSNISRTLVGNKNCRSLRSSWSIACRRCSNYIFILNLTPGFIGLAEDNCTTRRETSKFGDLVHLIFEILHITNLTNAKQWVSTRE